MRSKAFLDSNVFIFAFERPRSNSRRIVDLLVAGEVHGVVTDRVVREVMGYMRRYYRKDLAGKFRDLILLTCDLALEEDLSFNSELSALVGRKDAGALAAVRSVGLSRLVSTDSDFAKVPEHRTPREYLQELGESPRPGDE
jgi:predicted nucleic acid-binding protein